MFYAVDYERLFQYYASNIHFENQNNIKDQKIREIKFSPTFIFWAFAKSNSRENKGIYSILSNTEFQGPRLGRDNFAQVAGRFLNQRQAMII